MEKTKIISLLIATIYIILFIYSLSANEDHNSGMDENYLKGRGVVGVIIWLMISLGCIWWGDELGEGLIGAKFGLMSISSTSPGWAVKLMGWVLLLLPALTIGFKLIRGN